MNRSQQVQAVIYLDQLAAAATRHAATIRGELLAEARAELAAAGMAPTWRMSEVATVSARIAKDAVTVADPAAFAAWVWARFPEQVERTPVVRPAYTRTVAKAARPTGDGTVVDANGELIPGLVHIPGGAMLGISIVASDTAKEVFGGVAEEGLRVAATLAPPDWAGELVDLLDLGPALALADTETSGHLSPGEVA